MRKLLLLATATVAWAAAWASVPAEAASDKVVIGDIDDMSGVYADVIGPRAVEAIKMAIADFGGRALGKPIDIKSYDHQNKPDLGAQAFRRVRRPRRRHDGARRLQHRRQPRHERGRQGKEDPVHRHRRRRRLADRQGLHALYDPLRLRHDGARQRHRDDDPQAGRQELVLPHRRLRVRHAVAGTRPSAW